MLWLREYTIRYKQWVAQAKSQRPESREYRVEWQLHTSSQLAMFYARAKQTFFTPNSHYELNLPSDMLAPFHASNGSPHPDPAVFDHVAIDTRYMLKDSLRRFVAAQFNNVGNNRVLCGMIAGTVCCLLGALLPLIYNLARGNSRWLRLTALPGLWLGVTLLLTSLNGVCLGVYIFGDLRQLRKFELSRPPISKPQPLRMPRQRPVISSPITGLPAIPAAALQRPPRPTTIPPPLSYTPTPDLPSRFSPASSVSSLESSPSASVSCSGSDSDDMIHISPAFYDADPIEGPATSPVNDLAGFTFPVKPRSGFDDDDEEDEHNEKDAFGATAAFIHPFDPSKDDDYDFLTNQNKRLPEERQRISAFDFDALPERPRHVPAPSTAQSEHSLPVSQSTPSVLVIEPEAQPPSDNSLSLVSLISRIQSKCNLNKWLVITSSNPSATDQPFSQPSATDFEKNSHDVQPPSKPDQPNRSRSHTQRSSGQHDRVASESVVKKRFNMVKAVPAFASPLTRVLNPIVVRGQWEIVVRSTIIAFLISWIILGSLLAVPDSKRH